MTEYCNMDVPECYFSPGDWNKTEAGIAAEKTRLLAIADSGNYPSVDEVLKMDSITITRWCMNDAWWVKNSKEYWDKVIGG